MQTNVFYGNVLFVHANRFPSKQKISGTQHHSKQMCGTASFVNTSSPKTLVQQAEAGGRNEKNLHKRSAEAFFRDGHTLGACYKHISLDLTFWFTRIRSAYILCFSC